MSTRPGDPEAHALPAQLGRYRVRARLGEGATSEVFLARDDFRGRDVAIKRLRVNQEARADEIDEHYASRFFAAEAALVGRLEHPNVVRLFDAVDDGEQPYLVMEYVPGETLKRFCRSDRLLSLEQVVEVGFKCASALGYCWRQGLIHRDVKPANVLCVTSEDGTQVLDVKLTDFGSVLNLDSERTQVFGVGSLLYMAPEQLDGAELDCRADMYSLSAVLYHLIAGRPPFEAGSQPALMQLIAEGNPPSLVGCREGVTPALDALIRRGMARRREDRPTDWDDFAGALAALVSANQVPRAGRQAVLDSERFSLLRSLDFFNDFGDVQLWEVVRRARWERFEPGEHIYRKGQIGSSFHIIAEGRLDVYRDSRLVARLGAGTSVGEMAYLAPNPDLRTHSADVIVSAPATTVSFSPESLLQLTLATRSRFDAAFIKVLVRRLHVAHESLADARRAQAPAAAAATGPASAGAQPAAPVRAPAPAQAAAQSPAQEPVRAPASAAPPGSPAGPARPRPASPSAALSSASSSAPSTSAPSASAPLPPPAPVSTRWPSLSPGQRPQASRSGASAASARPAASDWLPLAPLTSVRHPTREFADTQAG